MADSLNDLEGLDFLKPRGNWDVSPQHTVGFNVDILGFVGGIAELYPVSDKALLRFNVSITNLTKQQENDIISFFVDKKGRNKRFWAPLDANFFTPFRDHLAGETQFEVVYNAYKFDNVNRRLCIRLKNDDFITSKITGFSHDSAQNKGTFTINTALDRNIAISDVEYVTLLLLVRFDMDQLEVTHITNNISDISLSFVELIREYDEL